MQTEIDHAVPFAAGAGMCSDHDTPSTHKQEPQQNIVIRSCSFVCADTEVIDFLQCGQIAVAFSGDNWTLRELKFT